jgi:hypothetical protein
MDGVVDVLKNMPERDRFPGHGHWVAMQTSLKYVAAAPQAAPFI